VVGFTEFPAPTGTAEGEMAAELLKTDCNSAEGEMQRVRYELSQGSQIFRGLPPNLAPSFR
jgi:hypothetical protein